MKPLLIRTLLLVIMGMIINSVLGWGTLAVSQYFSTGPTTPTTKLRRGSAITADEQLRWYEQRPVAFLDEATTAMHFSHWGFEQTLLTADQPQASGWPDVFELGDFKRAGWPLRSFEGVSWRRVEKKVLVVQSRTGIISVASLRNPSREIALPVHVMPVGFALNSLVFAAVLWILLVAPLKLRQRSRLQRGLCPACAYPIGESAVCTECGKQVAASVGQIKAR